MYFRRSKKVGPFNFTVSKSGISGSVGTGPFRYTMNSNGGRTTTVRTGIPGLSYQKRETKGQVQSKKAARAARRGRATTDSNFRNTVDEFKNQ